MSRTNKSPESTRPEMPLDAQYPIDVEVYVKQGFSKEMAKKEALDDLEMRYRAVAEATLEQVTTISVPEAVVQPASTEVLRDTSEQL